MSDRLPLAIPDSGRFTTPPEWHPCPICGWRLEPAGVCWHCADWDATHAEDGPDPLPPEAWRRLWEWSPEGRLQIVEVLELRR